MVVPIKNVLAVILFVIFISIFIPQLIRSMPVFLLIVSLAGFVFISQFKVGIYNNISFKIIIYFSVLGWMYLFASAIIQGWTELYRFDAKHIVRQSYFVIMLPLFVSVGVSIYGRFGEKFGFYLGRTSVYLFILLCVLDVLTAIVLGDDSFRVENGYAHFLDKGLIWFFGCVTYLYCIAYNIKKHFMFMLLNTFFIIETVAGYGVMFNAMTGGILYIMMFMFYLTTIISSLRKFEFLWYFSVISFLVSFVLIAPAWNELFIGDLNTYWRLTSWGNNLSAVYSNWGLGAGFGVAYFPNTPEALDAAYKSYLAEGSSYNMYDSLFVRGQHSSIINVFFRMGILGGGLLIWILISLLKQANNNRQSPDVRFLTPLFVCGVLNISVHVGLESPPFLITISLAAGMLLGAVMSSEKERGFNEERTL